MVGQAVREKRVVIKRPHIYWFGSGLLGGGIFMFGIYSYARWVDFTAGDFLALSQLVVDLFMVPITVIGFIIVISEFRKSQATYRLDLSFDTMTKEETLSKPAQWNKASSIVFCLHNTGSAVAIWYSINIELPNFLHVSNVDDLSAQSGHWLRVDKNSEPVTMFSFSSGGQNAVHPNHPLPLLKLKILLDAGKQYESQYEVPYTIVSEREGPVHGKLFVRVVAEQEQQVSTESLTTTPPKTDAL
jgi:hypothetical protein